MTKPSWADSVIKTEQAVKGSIYAVRMTQNKSPTVKDQISDVGKSYDECVTSAKLYCETSHYQLIEVITMRVTRVERIK